MLRYREVKPRIIELCKKYDIPYIEESVFTRAKKMVDIIVGNSKMKSKSEITAEAPTKKSRTTNGTSRHIGADLGRAETADAE